MWPVGVPRSSLRILWTALGVARTVRMCSRTTLSRSVNDLSLRGCGIPNRRALCSTTSACTEPAQGGFVVFVPGDEEESDRWIASAHVTPRQVVDYWE